MARSYFEQISPFSVAIGPVKREPHPYRVDEIFMSLDIMSTSLIRIHSELLQQLTPLRGKYIRVKDSVKVGREDNEISRNILTYGYERAGEKYSPHITLGTFPKEYSDVLMSYFQKYASTIPRSLFLEEIQLTYCTDATKQTEMQVLQQEIIRL